MLNKYPNFLSQSDDSKTLIEKKVLNGEDARKLYLEEVSGAKYIVQSKEQNIACYDQTFTGHLSKVDSISDKQLFLLVQNNKIGQLKSVLDNYPDKIHTLDEYGWSLLMIACQANAVEVFTELLKRGINTSVRDRAGNSVHTLVIKNKNLVLFDILLNYRSEKKGKKHIDRHKYEDNLNGNKSNEKFFCKRCNKTFIDKEEHLSSTLHNISASKGKKIIPTYVIPPSNKGYQIMLKTGWDRDRGLGPVGSGKIYPVKTVLKQDRKGLGLEKRKSEQDAKNNVKDIKNRPYSQYEDDKRIEINFRREFY